jgi:esterase/lipase
MKPREKHIFIILAILVCVVVLYVVGPRVPIDETIKPVNIPDDIEQYLRLSENRAGNIVSGAEKIIIWADSIKKEKTPLSIVYIHGFTATRQETAPLSELVARDLGANLFYTRLTGHGLDGEELAEATVNDWLNDAAEALEIGRRLGNRVVIVGTSTGGTLATWLAARNEQKNIAALILLSPNFGLRDPKAKILLLPWAEYIAPVIAGREQRSGSINPRHGVFWTHRYPTKALIPMMGLVDIIRKSDLAYVTIPVFAVYSPDDRIVDSRETEKTVLRFGSHSITICRVTDTNDPPKHIIAGDILAPDNTEMFTHSIGQFIEQNVL